jgi:hypothetical protein
MASQLPLADATWTELTAKKLYAYQASKPPTDISQFPWIAEGGIGDYRDDLGDNGKIIAQREKRDFWKKLVENTCQSLNIFSDPKRGKLWQRFENWLPDNVKLDVKRDPGNKYGIGIEKGGLRITQELWNAIKQAHGPKDPLSCQMTPSEKDVPEWTRPFNSEVQHADF